MVQVAQKTESPLLDEILNFTRLPKNDDSYFIAKNGVKALLEEVFKHDEKEDVRVDKLFVDELIQELDLILSKQMDAILHHPDFQRLEAPWRSLRFLIDRTDFTENIKIQYINATKEDLLQDFEDAASVAETGWVRQGYTEEFGQFGGEPVGAMIGNYEFTPSNEDIKLLEYMGSLGAMNHAPFVGAAGPSFFGLDDYE